MRRRVAVLAVFFAGMLRAGAAFGAENSDEPTAAEPSPWSAQLGLGIGGGTIGLAGSASAAGQGWLGARSGLGLELAALGQGDGGLGGTSAGAFTAIPHIALRSDGVGSTWFATAGIGYAYAQSAETEVCLLGGDCAPGQHFRAHGYAVELSGGYLFRFDMLLIGGVAKFYLVHALSSTSSDGPGPLHGIATLNLVIGLSG